MIVSIGLSGGLFNIIYTTNAYKDESKTSNFIFSFILYISLKKNHVYKRKRIYEVRTRKVVRHRTPEEFSPHRNIRNRVQELHNTLAVILSFSSWMFLLRQSSLMSNFEFLRRNMLRHERQGEMHSLSREMCWSPACSRDCRKHKTVLGKNRKKSTTFWLKWWLNLDINLRQVYTVHC